MQSLGQRYYREKLARLLSRTSLLDVIGMTWCAWAIQNGHADDARRHMRFSPEATDGSAGARLALYPWQLETLVNEAMVAPHRHDPRRRELVTQEFSAIFQLAKLVQRIEEADDRKFLSSNDSRCPASSRCNVRYGATSDHSSSDTSDGYGLR